MMDTLHLISVRETAAAEVTASGAKLAVRIAGQSFFTGSEAFKKAAEVASLVASLKEVGLSEDDVHLLSVFTEVGSGILSKSSSASYVLELHCQSVEFLGRVLAAVSSQKNAKIVAVAWQYPDIEKTKGDLVEAAVRAARQVAQSAADVLGTPLLGVHRLAYDVSEPDTRLRVFERSNHARHRVVTTALEALDLSHIAEVSVTVAAEFMVDTCAQPDA